MAKHKTGYWRSHYRKIETGEIEDDYSNHLLSHFGFYDENKIKLSKRDIERIQALYP